MTPLVICFGTAAALTVLAGIAGAGLSMRDAMRRDRLGEDACTLTCPRCDGNPQFACTCTAPCGRPRCAVRRAEIIWAHTDLTGELYALLEGDDHA